MYDILEKDFSESKFDSIFDKPYIVYDIETSNITDDIMEHEFFMAYFIDSVDKKYRYVDRESLRKFYEYLRDFDGYIV
jgi:hypothetical protein